MSMMHDYSVSIQQKVRGDSGDRFYADLALPDAFEDLAPGEAARLLRESEDRMRALVAATAQLVWTMPPNGVARDMPLWRAYTGQTSEAIAGWGWLSSIHPDDRARVSDLWQYAVVTCCPFEAEYRLRRYDGVYQVFLVRAVPVFEADGSLREWVGIHTDITERKELEDAQHQVAREAALHASELETTFEALTAGIVVYDAEGSVHRCNSAAHRLLGIKTDDDLRRLAASGCFHHLMPRDERGQPLSFDLWPPNRLLRGEVLTADNTADSLIRTLDGRDILLNVNGSPIYGTDGDVAGAVLVFHDVTERRRLERRTHDALDALLAIAEALVQSPNAPIPRDEAPEPEHLTAPPVTAPSVDAATSQAEAGLEAPPVTPPPANKTAQRLCELTRSVLGCDRVAIISVDLATQWQHPVAVVGFSPEQVRLWWVEQAANSPLSSSPYPDMLEQLRAGHVIPLALSDVLVSHDSHPFGVRAVLAAPLRIGETLVGIMLLDHGSAPHEYTQDELALAAAVAKLAALVIERERLLSERAEAQARELALREANRRMDEFLSIASHELRSPLTAIKATVQFAARQLHSSRPANGNAEQADPTAPPLAMVSGLLERAERQTNLLARLVDDLLDVSRIQANNLDMRPRKCDLGDIVRDAVREQCLAWQGRAINLTLPGVPVQVYADADRLGQVVTNYLTNALKYSQADRPVAVRLQIAVAQAESSESSESSATPRATSRIVRVEVRDDGPGLPLDEQPHIWERFHRAPGVEVKSGTGVGLGLGLHISKTIVERHGGQVGVVSAPGSGSTFWFTIPLLDAS